MSFGDTYMALRKKRIAEVKETGEVKKTPTVKTGNEGMGKVSTFGANYMELRQKRLQEEYAKATTLPDLSSMGLGARSPFDIGSDPYGRKELVARWKKESPEKYVAWEAYVKTKASTRSIDEIRADIDKLPGDGFVGPTRKTQLEAELVNALYFKYEDSYLKGDYDLSKLNDEMDYATAKIATLEQAVKDDENSLLKFSEYKNKNSVTVKMLEEEKKVQARLDQNKKELAQQKAVYSNAENQYDYFLGRVFVDEENDAEKDKIVAQGKSRHQDAWDSYDDYLDNMNGYKATLAFTPEEELSAALAPYREEARSHYPLAVMIEGLSEEDQTTFYYLVGRGLDAQALQFANERAYADRQAQQKDIRQWAGKNLGTGILASAGSLLMLPYSWSDAVLTDRATSATGLAYAGVGFGGIRDNLRAGVSGSLNEWSGTVSGKVPVIGEKGLGDLYQLGMSMADSFLGGLAFGAGGASPVLGGAAFSSAYNDAIDKGASFETAMLQGAAQGLAEMAFEYISLDKLFNEDAVKGFFKTMFIQGGIEASEEACTSIANFFADRWIMGGMSQYETSVREYMNSGMTEEEARKKAKWDFVENTAADAFGGFISGSGSAAFQTGISNSKASKTYGPYARELVAKAVEQNPGNAFAKQMQKNIEAGKTLSGNELRQVAGMLDQETLETIIKAAESELTESAAENEAGSTGSQLSAVESAGTDHKEEVIYEEPNWEQYEQDHSGERFQYDPSQEQIPQVEDMQGWREDTYEKAQGFTDQELVQAIEEEKAKRDDASKDNKSRAIAQYHLDALELVQAQRNEQTKNATQSEWQPDGGLNYGGTESVDDGGQRDAGLGTDRQGRSLAEGPGRSIARGQGKTEAAIVEDLRKNATAQSAREIGIRNGSKEASVWVIPDEKVAESAQWSAIKADAESHGHRVVFVAGRMETVDTVTGKRYAHEGIRQVDAQGNVTYYIKVDKKTRDGGQIYRHEDFHDVVDNNPKLLGDLVIALEMEYGKQEILRLVNRYVEAFDGIYGRFVDNMTEEQEYDLIMDYMEEVFADVYADIQRGKFATDTAQKIMRDQTEAVRRGAQNRNATERKTAPPSQKYAIETTKDGMKFVRADRQVIYGNDPESWGDQVENYIDRRIRNREDVVLTAEDGDLLILTKDTVGKSSFRNYVTDGNRTRPMTDSEYETKLNAEVHIDELAAISTRGPKNEPDEGGLHGEMAENGWNYRKAYFMDFDGKYYRLTLSVAMGRNGNAVYNVSNIRERSFPTNSGSSENFGAQSGKTSSKSRIPHGEAVVKQNFSVDDSKVTLEGRVSGDEYLDALDLIEEIESVGAQVDEFGYVTLYHRTSDLNARTIKRTGMMYAKEDGLFFSTNANGENNYGYGEGVVEFKVPAEMLVLDDIFVDEASVKIPLENGRRRMNVSEYIVREENTEKQSFSVDDEAYMDAVESGNVETQERMVAEAAERAGYTIRAYHGTPNGTFNVFKSWQYFTEEKEIADRYQNQGASSISYKKTADNPKTYGVFLKTDQPFDTRNAEERELFYREFYRQWGNGAPLSERGLPDWTDGEDMVEFFEENDYQYDAIYLDEGGTGGYGDEVIDRGISIMIKSSEQIKSAEPVTYDNDGNVIPLSERFDVGKTDIRYSVDDDVQELDEEYSRKMAEDEEPRRGKSEPEWDAVRGSMDEYNAAAKELKIKRAEKQSITALKNRIQKNEQMLRELSNMRTMAKKSNFLSMNMDKEIERRKGIIQETLEIDRAVLKNKEDAKRDEIKTRKQKKQEEEIQKVKAQKATEDMVTEVMNLFFIKKGVRYEVREMLYELADQTVKDGRITDEIRDKLLGVLYENSEVIIEPNGSIGDIRKFVQHTKIYVPEDVRAAFGEEWDSFRNAAFGNRIYFTSNSNDMSIDSAMKELEKVFGSIAPEGATLKERLERILDLAEEGKAEKISLREMMERNSEEGWSVEDQMDEMERKLDQILLTFSEKAGFEIDIKQKTLRKLNKQREEFRRTLERQRDKSMENELMNQVRKRAQRLKAYYKRATPSVRRMIDEQIGDLDTLARSISQKGLEDIQQIIDSYNQTAAELGEAFIANSEIVARLERVKQRHLDDMTVEEVRTLGEALTGIIQQIQNYNKMVSEERNLLITDMANRAQKEIVESEGTKTAGYLRKFMMGQLNAKVFFGKISGYADGAWKWLSDRLSHGEEMERQYQQRATALFDTFLSDKKNQEWLKKASGKNAVWETVSVKGSLVLEDGATVGSVDSIELTPMMKVSLLMHSKNDDNLRHIGHYEKSGDVYGLMGGGVTIPDKALYKKGDLKEAYAKGQVLVIPPDVVRTIAKNCTEQEKAFAALLTKYFDGMAKSAINEVSLQVDGWERAVVVNYFPIQSDKAFIVSENGLLVQDMSLRGSPFLKERSHKGKNPMFLFDATDVLYRNIEQVSKYYGLTRPLRDLHAVMNATYYQTERKTVDGTSENELLRKVKEQEGWGKVSVGSVEKALISKWGHDAKTYIEKLSAHLQGAKSEGSVLDDLLTGLRGRYARSVISFNPSSVAKQISSYFVAYAYLDAGDLTKGLVTTKYGGNIKEAVMNLSKYSAVYWYRNQGNVNAEIREYTERKGTLERLPLGFQWTQMMDSAVTRRLLAACMHHVSKEMKLQPGSQESIDAGTDRYWSEVAKLFNKVVLDTQSNTSTMERPDIVRGDKNSVAKFITMFRTDAFQQHNLQVEARGMRRAAKKAYEANQTDANKKRLQAANKHLAKTTAAVFMGQLTVGLITSLLAYLSFRDKDYYDEEGEFSWKKFLGDVVVNTAEGYAGMILGLDWIASLVESKIAEEKWYGPEVLGLESVKTFGEDVVTFFKAAVALDFQEGKKQLRKLAKSAGFVFGIPVSNIEKYILMVTRWFAPEFAERWENIWDETEKGDLQYRAPGVMEEAISVILDNRVDNLSDDDKAEIARLYIAGGTGAVPSAIPTSFSFTNEDGEEVTVTLSPKQKEQYREIWNEYATAGLADILASEQYESADDKGRTEYIDKLYKFAGQMAKSAVEPKKEPEKWVQQGLDAQKNGVSLGEYAIFRVDLTGVSGKNEEGETVDGLQMQRSMELLEAMGWTDRQEESVWSDVVASESVAEKTEALMNAGLTWNQTNDIIVLSGNKLEKMAAIVKTGQKDSVVVKAMCVYASEKEKKLLTMGLEYDVKPEWYIEVLENANADGKGQVTQKEAEAYIFGMDLSLQEKAVLFQMVTDAKEGKSNPFYPSYAAEFYYAVHEDDAE